MVVSDTALVRSTSRRSYRARFGAVFEVARLEGDRIWIKGLDGWVSRGDVVAYESAVDHMGDVIKKNPSTKAYHRRGLIRSMQGDDAGAVEDFTAAIKLDSKNLPAYNDRGDAFRRLGKFDEAIKDFDNLVSRRVRHPGVFVNRGLVWIERGVPDRALADFNAALSLDSRFAPAWEAAGTAREALGDYRNAVANYKKAVRYDERFARAHNNLAWLYATCPDKKRRSGRRAVEHATKACKLTGFQDAGFVDTLAAALAERGKFKDAVERARQALELADESRKPVIEHRLRLYLAEEKFRQ